MTLFRTPDSPGHSGRNAASAAAGSAKMLGPTSSPLTNACLGLDAFGAGPFGMASPSMFQFVAQVNPLSIVMGKPLVQRKMPDTFQSPIKALSTGLMLSMKLWPLPTGRSQMTFALTWWKALKSDNPRSDSGS